MTSLIIGVLVGLLGIVGLFLASGAYDVGMATFGVGLAGFAIWMNFWLIKLHFDAARAAPAEVPVSVAAE